MATITFREKGCVEIPFTVFKGTDGTKNTSAIMSGSSDDHPHVVALEQLPDPVQQENFRQFPTGKTSASLLHLANEYLKSARTDP